MADKKRAEDIDEGREINPDGADLDGTAEIERQRGEQDSGPPRRSTESAVPPVA
jgi:hypothetical protein